VPSPAAGMMTETFMGANRVNFAYLHDTGGLFRLHFDDLSVLKEGDRAVRSGEMLIFYWCWQVSQSQMP
jgi:hypothetical protein